jgi:hypothetical protein
MPLPLAFTADGANAWDTTSGSSALTGTCGGATAPEQVYAFTQAATADLLVTVAPSLSSGNLRPVIYLRSDCGVTSDVDCGAVNTNIVSSLRITGLDASNYFLVVDSNGAGNAGPYTLSTFQGPPPGDSCTLAPRPVNPGTATQIILAGDLTGMADDYTPMGCGTAGSRDVLYAFTAPRDGTLTVRTRGTFDIALAATDGMMCASAMEVGCSDQDLGGDTSNEVLTFNVVNGSTYWVWVNAYGSSDVGPYQVSFDLP